MAVGPASLVLRLPWHNHQAPRSVKRSVPSVRSSASATHFATSVSARSVFVESVRVMALSILSMVLSILLSSRSAESATHQPNSVTLMRPSCRWFGSLLVSYLRWRDAVEGCGLKTSRTLPASSQGGIAINREPRAGGSCACCAPLEEFDLVVFTVGIIDNEVAELIYGELAAAVHVEPAWVVVGVHAADERRQLALARAYALASGVAAAHRRGAPVEHGLNLGPVGLQQNLVAHVQLEGLVLLDVVANLRPGLHKLIEPEVAVAASSPDQPGRCDVMNCRSVILACQRGKRARKRRAALACGVAACERAAWQRRRRAHPSVSKLAMISFASASERVLPVSGRVRMAISSSGVMVPLESPSKSRKAPRISSASCHERDTLIYRGC